MRRFAAAAVAALLLGAGPAAAQTPTRPGPWVLDVRGVTSPVPEEPVFYPRLHTTALVPGRGFGLGGGAHVYLADLGPSRLGIGAHVMSVRGVTKPAVPEVTPAPGSPGTPTTPVTPIQPQQVQIDLRTIGSEVSFNFGSRDGWSYLSGGIGFTDVTATTAVVDAGRRESGRLGTLNVGGGARWFMKSRLAFGFDVRMYRIGSGDGGTVEQEPPASPAPPLPAPAPAAPPAPTPGKMILMVGVGVSLR